MKDIPIMLTIRETAEKSGLPYSSIMKMCHCNKITYIKLGTKYLVNWDRFIDYLNGEEVISNDE